MANTTPLDRLVVSPTSKHSATVIFVHDLGDTGNGWKPVADVFRSGSNSLSHVKWVLPHSPERPVTANMSMAMPSWFDVYSFGFDVEEDEKGMLQTVHQLNQLITAEIDSGVPASRIILGGLGQGGAMALLTGLTSERQLAGVVVMRGWLPLRHKIQSMISDHANKVPIWWGHGRQDPIVKLSFCEGSTRFLTSRLGVTVSTGPTDRRGLTYKVYDGVAHSTNQQELDELREWIEGILPKDV